MRGERERERECRVALVKLIHDENGIVSLRSKHSLPLSLLIYRNSVSPKNRNIQYAKFERLCSMCVCACVYMCLIYQTGSLDEIYFKVCVVVVVAINLLLIDRSMENHLCLLGCHVFTSSIQIIFTHFQQYILFVHWFR